MLASFKHQTNVQKHMRFSHPAQSFKCEFCQKAFDHRKTLQLHLRTDHAEETAALEYALNDEKDMQENAEHKQQIQQYNVKDLAKELNVSEEKEENEEPMEEFYLEELSSEEEESKQSEKSPNVTKLQIEKDLLEQRNEIEQLISYIEL